jgi:hypothetical protein
MKRPIGTLKLPASEQNQWLKQHITHRIRAVLPGIRYMAAPWDIHLPLLTDVRLRCLGNSVHEGRHSAMRWLIFFVGLMEQGGVAIPTKYRTDETDVWIERFEGGVLFDHTTPEAQELAQIYRGCTQATGHPTRDTNHPDIAEPRLSLAMRLILPHLQRTIYNAKGLDLAAVTLRMTDLP